MNNTIVYPTLGLPRNIFYFFFIALFAGSLFLQSCGAGMVPRDDYSLTENEAIQKSAVSLIKQGGEDYSTQADSINALTDRIGALTDYERAKGDKNKKTVKMWELMMDPNQALLGGFLKRWKNEGKLNAGFVNEMSKVVNDNFKKIINLEKKKKKP